MPRPTESQKVDILHRLLKHLKERFLMKCDFTPRTLDQLLRETFNTDADPQMKTWLRDIGLPNMNRIHVTRYGGYLYKPPLPCRDAASFWKLLEQYDRDGPLGMLRDDVVDSIPGKGKAEAAIERFNSKIDFIFRVDKKEVLFIRDTLYLRNFSQLHKKLWHSVDISQVDSRQIESRLAKVGISVEEKKFKKPRLRPKLLDKSKDSEETSVHKVRHIKDNIHVMGMMQDHSQQFRRKSVQQKCVQIEKADGNLRVENAKSSTSI